MRVCHVITGLGTGGAEAMLFKLLRASAGSDVEHSVISMTGTGTFGPCIEGLGVPLTSLRMRHARPRVDAVRRTVALLRAENPDIVQGWMYHGNLLASVAAGAAAVPTVAWNIRCSDMSGESRSLLSRSVVRMLGFLSPMPHAVIVNSEAGRAVHEKLGYSPRRWEVIPNGFETDVFKPDSEARRAFRLELGIPDDAPVVGLIARFHPMKDHATFLQALPRIREALPTAHFVLVGTGVDTANEELSALLDPSLAPAIHLLGERKDMPRVFASLDVACLSSAFGEGFPNVLGEALACGVPCVATDVGDSAAVVGPAGIIVPARSADRLAEATLQVLRMPPDVRAQLSRIGRARIVERFSIASVTSHYLALYRSLLNARAT